ncbi:4-beta-xylanase, partial [Striga asiatica]
FAIKTQASEPYDYSVSIDCVPEALPPQYNGGIIENPSFDFGLKNWKEFGNAKVEPKKSKAGNPFLVAFDRKNPTDSVYHWVNLKNDTIYAFSGSELVSAYYTGLDNRSTIIGSTIAKSGCWSQLKGGFTPNEDVQAALHFSTNNTDAELWVDSVSLKPFTNLEWQAHQNKTIDQSSNSGLEGTIDYSFLFQFRKRTIRIHVSTREGKKLGGGKVSIRQTRPKFVIGSGTPESILTHKEYQDYFIRRFTAATFHNEMKWYFTETYPDVENYTVPDAMTSFFRAHRIPIRGHTILWASTNLTQYWVKRLSPPDILKAAVRRVGSVVSRYSPDVIGWDVMNENLHNSFYEENLGPNASAMFYQIVHALDLGKPLFLNEYVDKIRETKAFPGNEQMKVYVGLQGHFFRRPMVSYIRAVLDTLGATGNPIWITELDTRRGPTQAPQLEEVMREAYSHPAVEGIIVWGGWKPTGCNQTCLEDTNYYTLPTGCSVMCLVDNNFRNLPPGDVVDKLIDEWKSNVDGVTDGNGVFQQRVFLGSYKLKFEHPEVKGTVKRRFNVTVGERDLEFKL